MKIKINHIAKTEGSAGLVAELERGRVLEARLLTQEGARLFEGILVGRHYTEAGEISSRICGICPVVHFLTALKAIEGALGVKVSKQTLLLRKLLMLGQIIQSHAMHIYFLSLPDYLGIKDSRKMFEKHPQLACQALAARDFGNRICAVVGGRSVHPVTPKVGGFYAFPASAALRSLRTESVKILPLIEKLVRWVGTVALPSLESGNNPTALFKKGGYAICDGEVLFEKKPQSVAKAYLALKEQCDAGEMVKRVSRQEQGLLVGALARLNYSQKYLNPRAAQLLKDLAFKLPSQNPFRTITAQALELAHCVEEVKVVTTKLLHIDLEKGNVKVKVRAGEAVAAIEAPRGTLYHYYKLDKTGIIIDCNIITPTAQLLLGMERDIKKYLPSLKDRGEAEIQMALRTMVRAYDPCISCATH